MCVQCASNNSNSSPISIHFALCAQHVSVYLYQIVELLLNCFFSSFSFFFFLHNYKNIKTKTSIKNLIEYRVLMRTFGFLFFFARGCEAPSIPDQNTKFSVEFFTLKTRKWDCFFFSRKSYRQLDYLHFGAVW